MILTEETAKALNENIERLLKIVAPKMGRVRKSKKQMMIDDKIERLNRKHFKSII